MATAARRRLQTVAASQGAVWVALALVLALSSYLRFGAAAQTVVVKPVASDAADYFHYALNLKQHGIYARQAPRDPPSPPEPDSLRPPGYPLFIAALTGPLPGEIGLPQIRAAERRITTAQAVVGVGVTALVFLLAQSILGRWWAVLAALLTAASPHLVNAGVYLLTETLFSLALIALALVLARRDLQLRLGWVFVAGLIAGAAALVRPTANYLPLVLPVLLLLRWPRASALRGSAALLLGFALLYAPWVARNAALPGGADDQLMINMLHHGMYPDFMYQDNPETLGYPYRADPRSAEIASSLSAVTAEIARRFAEEPGRHLAWYLAGKPVALWSWNEVQGAGAYFVYNAIRSPYYDSLPFHVTAVTMHALHWAVVLLAAGFCGAIWAPRAQALLPPAAVLPAQACALLLLYVTALHVAGFPLPRYATPFRPELYVAASAGLYLLVCAVQARRTPAPAAP